MKPFVLTIAGVALGVAAVLPLAVRQSAAPSVVALGQAPRTTAIAGSAPPTAAAGQTVTVTGPVVQNRYGPVQVKVVLVGGTVTEVSAVQLPSGGNSGEVSGYAAPQLSASALASQGKSVDTVSGASYTSDSYQQSLQAAMDTARAAAQTSAATPSHT